MARPHGTTLFVVRGREFWGEAAYETRIPGRYFLPKRREGDQFATLGVDCFESQSDARRQALENYRGETALQAERN